MGDRHPAGHRRRVARRRPRLLLDTDVLVGTSAGSTVAAPARQRARVLTSCSTGRPTASSTELTPTVGIDEITELFLAAMTQPGCDDSRETAEDRRSRAVDGDRHRGRAARRDRRPTAEPRLAAAGPAHQRNRHRHRRTGRIRSDVGCRSGRRGGRQLRRARRLAAGDDRRPALHGRRRRQHRQPDAGGRLRCRGCAAAARQVVAVTVRRWRGRRGSRQLRRFGVRCVRRRRIAGSLRSPTRWIRHAACHPHVAGREQGRRVAGEIAEFLGR